MRIHLALFFLLRTMLAFLGLLWLHMYFRVCFSISLKKVGDILIVTALNLKIVFGRMIIVRILLLLIHDHERSFYLLASSLVSFFRDLRFSLQRSFTSLSRFVIRYFILFETIVNRNVSVRSFSVCCWYCIKRLLIFIS